MVVVVVQAEAWAGILAPPLPWVVISIQSRSFRLCTKGVTGEGGVNSLMDQASPGV